MKTITETTIENNKLIAEFTQKGTESLGLYDYDGCHYKINELKFHASWDWLMPCIEKIESLGHGVTIYRKGCQINDAGLFSGEGFNYSSKIEQTYKTVIEFIKWHNKNK